jgi:hypothetical protein
MTNLWKHLANRRWCQQFTVDIQPSKTLRYADDGLGSLEHNVFYVPEKTNKSVFDSFILVDDFKIRTRDQRWTHRLRRPLLFPPRKKWRLVFIIPANLVLTDPQPWKVKLRSLSAVVRAKAVQTR